MAWKAASITAAGVPTKVTTVRLVAFPGSTLRRRTPGMVSMVSVICLMISGRRPSLKLGTHSMSCSIAGKIGKKCMPDLLLHRPPPGADKVERIGSEIPPEDAQELGIFAEADTAAANGYDKGKREAHEEIQKADAEHP